MYFAAIGDMPSRRCDDRSLSIIENCTLTGHSSEISGKRRRIEAEKAIEG
jgi:hypothetical protein